MGGASHLLAFDVGNTQITAGVFDGPDLRAVWRLHTDPRRTADELHVLLAALMARDGVGPEAAAAACSVVPAADAAIGDAVRRLLGTEVLWAHGDMDLGMPVAVDEPAAVGADRLVNAVAARARYGSPVVVVDCGTATTIDVVGSGGAFEGGIIAPGIATCADALAARGAKLPRIPLEMPGRVVGKSTVAAMQAGVLWGHAAMVRGLLDRIDAELGGAATVVATGGLAPLLAPHVPRISRLDTDLTLEGVRRVHERHGAGTR